MNTDNCQQRASAGMMNAWMDNFISIHWVFTLQLEPFDGNYPYSLKYLFMRVYTGNSIYLVNSFPCTAKWNWPVFMVLRVMYWGQVQTKSVFIHPIFYNLKFVGPLEFKLVAPMSEQLKTAAMHFYEASRRRYISQRNATLFWCNKIIYLGPQIVDYKDVCCTTGMVVCPYWPQMGFACTWCK